MKTLRKLLALLIVALLCSATIDAAPQITKPQVPKDILDKDKKDRTKPTPKPKPAPKNETPKTKEDTRPQLDYILNKDNKTASVRAANKSITTANIPASIKVDGNDFTVTKINEWAFAGCGGLTSVIIPNSVTSIGESAFQQCLRLTSVTIPNSVRSIGRSAFLDCRGLTSITIPNSVTSIGFQAFCGCRGLTSVTIPNSVTSIGESAFSSCLKLKNIVVDSNNPNYCSIDGVLFTKNKKLIVSYPAGLRGSYTVPPSVTSIVRNAFASCSGLTSVTIPNSVTSIGEYAFYACTGLTSITIPNSVTSIGKAAFSNCLNLTNIGVDSNNPNYCSIDGVLFTKDKKSIVSYPAGLKGSYTIPNSVTSIGMAAFLYCSGLKSVTIPNSVTSIGDDAFWECSGLTSVYCYATTPPGVKGSFGLQRVTLHVPKGCKAAYANAPRWSLVKKIVDDL